MNLFNWPASQQLTLNVLGLPRFALFNPNPLLNTLLASERNFGNESAVLCLVTVSTTTEVSSGDAISAMLLVPKRIFFKNYFIQKQIINNNYQCIWL